MGLEATTSVILFKSPFHCGPNDMYLEFYIIHFKVAMPHCRVKKEPLQRSPAGCVKSFN